MFDDREKSQHSGRQVSQRNDQPKDTNGRTDDTAGAKSKPPSVSLPKGGGAIKGIGEKFGTNPVTGTGTMSIPLPTSPGRSEFGPHLSLTYDSGNGNSAFGLGWHLSLPSITRKTDKGLPQYLDADDSDVFLLTGVDDLVPVLVKKPGGWKPENLPPRNIGADSFQIRRYRPRIEGTFSRIERWTNRQTGDTHWRSITRANVTTVYGKNDNSRCFSPAAGGVPKRIFSWLISETFDDKGNAVVYEYVAEDSKNVDTSLVNERNRERGANRYLRSIKYGNRVSRLLQPDLALADWMFEVVFDYDEGRYQELPLNGALPEAGQHRFVRAALAPVKDWPNRPDPFSVNRAGFEVRTHRRCRRVLMFHKFPELGSEPCLVGATEFDYADFNYASPTATIDDELKHQGSSRFASFIRNATHSGFVRDATVPVVAIGGVNFVTYLRKSLPPVEFSYSKAVIRDDIQTVSADSIENLPVGLDGNGYQWVDLDGEGVSGILTDQGGALFYKRNLGNATFGPMAAIPSQPSLVNLHGGNQQLLDLAGDGQLDLVAFSGAASGFYERTRDERWEPFQPFSSLPNLAWNDPNLRFIDLNGDGHADILLTEDEVITWYPSLAEEGFAAAIKIYNTVTEERGPRLLTADGTQSIYLSDMSGDGLTDLVRIRNGEICYWPNLGYGRFGAKVTMDNAPWFDSEDQFSQHRVRLADIDGSGTTDIVYLGRKKASVYFNQSGNRWTRPRTLPQFPTVDNVATVTVADLLGNGTACLVWSSALPDNVRAPLHYIDLMGAKPHLLVHSTNNLGSETAIHYTPSTKFYLADKKAGKPWITKIPFPVHVVERVETFDQISGNRFVTRYEYHHGYYDGVEREFRGFGLVEQRDTEEFAALNANQQFPSGTNIDEASHVPPVLTRTWFHTGPYLDRERISDYFAGQLNDRDVGEYYREPGLTDEQARESLLDDTVLPAGLTLEEEREACRALKGSMLRQEIYALDGSLEESHPYVVTEQNFTVESVQPQGRNRFAVFFTHTREVLTIHYERKPTDPRIVHALTLDVDPFGNILSDAIINYGRRLTVRIPNALGGTDEVPNPGLALVPASHRAKQTTPKITYTLHSYTNPIEADDDYRIPFSAETKTYELTGLVLPAGRKRFEFEEVRTAGATAAPLDYEQTPTAGQQKRLIEHQRVLYRRNDLTGPLLLGQLESMALSFENHKLALTPGLVTNIYGGRVSNAMLQNEARYVHSQGDANWWIPSGLVFFSPDPAHNAAQELTFARSHFFLPHRYRDPFYASARPTETVVSYDVHNLLIVDIMDALGSHVTIGERNLAGNITANGNDYRVLQPRSLMDQNRNRSEVVFDALAMVVGTAVRGKPEDVPQVGDQITASFRADLTRAEIAQFFQNPLAPFTTTLLDQATTRMIYDTESFWLEPLPQKKAPPFAATLARETHSSDPAPAGGLRVQVSFCYSDGFGRDIQKKAQAEAGPVPQRGADGRVLVDAHNELMLTPGAVSPRWVGSGWTVYNNKGKATREYDPFFTDTHKFEFDVRIGVSPIHFFDPIERAVATLDPNHSFDKVTFDPWLQAKWDVNDTALIADPRTDPDVGDFFRRLPVAEVLPTWHTKRQGGALGPAEQRAARKTEIHANTPLVAHSDVLGHTFWTVVHNKFKYSNTPAATPPTEEFYGTFVSFDIEGNQREVTDARNRVIIRYDYDMLGDRIRQTSMEAGTRHSFSDVSGKLLYAWDSRSHQFRTDYDQLRRPTDSFLTTGAGAEQLIARSIYGESRPNPEANNLRGKAVQIFDQAGTVNSDNYDFKGNLLISRRQLAQTYKATLDWSGAVPLDPAVFTSSTKYDALNRPVELTSPDATVIHAIFNEGNLLERLEANLRGAATLTTFVSDIDYDANGLRTSLDYGNGVKIIFEYDRLTTHLKTVRSTRNPIGFPDDCPGLPPAGWPGCQVQNLHYTYDAAGNVTEIRDDAQQTVYFRNKRVEPNCEYTYDASYRLIEATGREHLGQIGNPPIPGSYNDKPRVGILLSSSDGNAMGRYIQRYVYDQVGNFLQMNHEGSDPVNPGWNRTYHYDDLSQINPADRNNRLTSLSGTVGETYSTGGNGYDAHGNMLRMPQLQILQWDYKDQLQMTQRQAVNPSDDEGIAKQGERTWYVYEASGQRIRKVTESPGGQIKEERIYLGVFELYRRLGANPLVRETLHVMDDKHRVAIVETRTQGTEPGVPAQVIRYQFSNHLGSASLELDRNAQIISYEEYYPYGNTSFQAVSGQTETKRYRFIGKERDSETGLYYHGARYYASWIGRWTAVDPKGLDESPNLYVYCSNNPTGLIDPNGAEDKDWRSSLSTMQRFALWVDDKVMESPSARAVVLNMEKRGKDIVEGVAQPIKEAGEDYADLAFYTIHSDQPDASQKINAALQRRAEAPVNFVKGAVVGFGQTVKRAGEAAGDVAFYTTEGRNDPDANAKIASAVTDLVMDVPQIVLTVEGGANLAKSMAGPKAIPKPPVKPPKPPVKPPLPPEPPVPPKPTVTPPKPPVAKAAAPPKAPAPKAPKAPKAAPKANTPKASAGKKWKVGDPHDAPTAAGRTPTWSTVRNRYWKNRAQTAAPGEFSPSNLSRMRAGKAPIDPHSGLPMELEHMTPQRTGSPTMHRDLLEVTPLEHSFFDRFRKFTDPNGRRWNTSIRTDPRP